MFGSTGSAHRRAGDGAIFVRYGETKAFFRESCTWTVPEGVSEIEISMVGAGGGCSDAHPGGPGEYVPPQKLSVVPGQVFKFHVGVGGKGGLNGSAGEAGGNTSYTPSDPRAASPRSSS